MELLFECPDRMRREHQEILELATTEPWLVQADWSLSQDLDVIVNVGMSVGKRTVRLVLKYPKLFPDVPAVVLLQDGVQLSSHQYVASGELCLEYGPDNWSRDVSGATLLRSAYKLLVSELGGVDWPPVPSRHQQTPGQELRGAILRYMLLGDLRETLSAAPPHSRLEIQGLLQHSGSTWVMLVSIAREGEQSAVSALHSVHWSLKQDGTAITLPASAIDLRPNPSLDELKAHLGVHWPCVNDVNGQLLLLHWPGRSPRLFDISTTGEGTATEYTLVDLGQEQEQRTPDELASVGRKSVGIVGLGSVGSKVAATLARSGVGNFVLVDDDILAPHNLGRHDLDLREVGLHKSLAVHKALKCINPHAIVFASTLRLGGQERAGGTSVLLEKLGSCDVIIDATGNQVALDVISAVASRRKKPVVIGEVFGGGYGGLIARARPEIEPPAAEVRANIQTYMDSRGFPQPAPEKSYTAIEDNVVFIASDTDVSQLASALAQMALDLLKEGETQFPYSAYLLGFRPGWIFEEPFTVKPLELPPPTSPRPVEERVKGISDPRFPVDLFTDIAKDLLAKRDSAS